MLEVSLCRREGATYLEDAFLLVVPYIGRLESLIIAGTEDLPKILTQHTSCSVPLLRKLTINISCDPGPVLKSTLFNGDLSSLQTLSLTGVTTYLPWKNMSNLTTFKLCHVPEDGISITQLLDFFENAHRIRNVTFIHSIATSSDASSGRVVSLSRLRKLTITADPPAHSILLNHLIIPVRALLTLGFEVDGNEPPLRDFLPKKLGNLKNIRSVTSVDLRFDGVKRSVRLEGPIGKLHIFGHWNGSASAASFGLDRQVFQSLNHFALSGGPRTDGHKVQTSNSSRS